jgi:ATP/ADP translocase
MPRWNPLFVLRAAQFARVASLAVAIVSFCAAANWIGNLGWHYKWPTAPLLIATTIVALAVKKFFPKSLIGRLKRKVPRTN